MSPAFTENFQKLEIMMLSNPLTNMVKIVGIVLLSEILFLGYNLILASTEVEEEEEYFLYDVSLISELGGAMGLFLGFSFFMITDYIAPMQHYMKKRFIHFFPSAAKY